MVRLLTRLTRTLLFFGLGAGTMLFADPVRGRARRAMVRDKLYSSLLHLQDFAQKGLRDLANHARGVFATLAACLRENDAPPAVLEERVRAQLGRVLSHPHAVEVRGGWGAVTLGGFVLASEFDALLAATRRVPGIREVVCQLAVCDTPDGIPALQGGRHIPAVPPSGSWPLLSRHSPGGRLLLAAGGAGLALYGWRRRDLLGTLLLPVGLTVAARALMLHPQPSAGRGARTRAPIPPESSTIPTQSYREIQEGYPPTVAPLQGSPF